jgi:hypothetical protein
MPKTARCANCFNVSPIPDKFLGRKIRCKNCGAEFVATPMKIPAADGVTPAAKPTDGAGPVTKTVDQSGRQSARSTTSSSNAAAVTVVARRVRPAPKAQGSPVWLFVAVLALVLPVAGAGGFAAKNWDPGRSNQESKNKAAEPKPGVYAAIEVSSSSVKFAYFEVESGPDGDALHLIDPRTTDANLVAGMDKTGRFDGKEMEKSVRAVAEFHALATQKYKLPPDRVFILGSSGLKRKAVSSKPSNEKDKKAQNEKNQNEQEAAIKAENERNQNELVAAIQEAVKMGKKDQIEKNHKELKAAIQEAVKKDKKDSIEKNLKELDDAIQEAVKKDKKDPIEEKLKELKIAIQEAVKKDKKDPIEEKLKELEGALEAVKKDVEMEFVDEAKEIKYQIKRVVGKADSANALFVDVGSGATRGGYQDSAGMVKIFNGLGSKQYQGVVEAKVKAANGAQPFEALAPTLAEDELCTPFRIQLDKESGARSRQRIYLSGGIVWIMANYQKPEQGWVPDDRFVRLSHTDVRQFAEAMYNNKAPEAPLKNVADRLDDQQDDEQKKMKEKMNEDVRNMRDKFSKDRARLIAGAEVLKALSKELDFKHKALLFDRDSQFAWFLQYVADKFSSKN